jgi:hypothetical protein
MRLLLSLLMLGCLDVPGRDRAMQDGERATESVRPVRIFGPGLFADIRSARIFHNRQSATDGKTGEEVEVCHISNEEGLSRLRLTLSYISGYRVASGFHGDGWEIRIRLDNARDIFLSNNWTQSNPQVIIKDEDREFLVSPESESRVRRIFDCRTRLSS